MSATQINHVFAGVEQGEINSFLKPVFTARPHSMSYGSPAFVPARAVNATNMSQINFPVCRAESTALGRSRHQHLFPLDTDNRHLCLPGVEKEIPMMNSLDSRRLTLGDCFAQRFPLPGQIRCFLSHASRISGTEETGDEDLMIEVRSRATGGPEPKQVDIEVNTDGAGRLHVDVKHVSIETGDGVLFYTVSPTATGFVVSGLGPNFKFDSSRISNGAVYTHAFGTPGRYRWVDPNGGEVSGVVEVTDLTGKGADGHKRWFEIMKKPAAFEIKRGQSTPEKVDIVVGQTVFWSITDSQGVSITDARLAASHR